MNTSVGWFFGRISIVVIMAVAIGFSALDESQPTLTIDPVRVAFILSGALLSIFSQLYLWGRTRENVLSLGFWLLAIFGIIFAPILLKDVFVEYKKRRACEKVIESRQKKVQGDKPCSSDCGCNFKKGPIN